MSNSYYKVSYEDDSCKGYTTLNSFLLWQHNTVDTVHIYAIGDENDPQSKYEHVISLNEWGGLNALEAIIRREGTAYQKIVQPLTPKDMSFFNGVYKTTQPKEVKPQDVTILGILGVARSGTHPMIPIAEADDALKHVPECVWSFTQHEDEYMVAAPVTEEPALMREIMMSVYQQYPRVYLLGRNEDGLAKICVTFTPNTLNAEPRPDPFCGGLYYYMEDTFTEPILIELSWPTGTRMEIDAETKSLVTPADSPLYVSAVMMEDIGSYPLDAGVNELTGLFFGPIVTQRPILPVDYPKGQPYAINMRKLSELPIGEVVTGYNQFIIITEKGMDYAKGWELYSGSFVKLDTYKGKFLNLDWYRKGQAKDYLKYLKTVSAGRIKFAKLIENALSKLLAAGDISIEHTHLNRNNADG